MTGGEALRAGAIAAAWDWWRDAGVDCDFHDEATAWLAEPQADVAAAAPAVTVAPRPAPPPAAPRPRIGGSPDGWPKTLNDFSAWWLAELSLDEGRIEGRIAPRGAAGARMMVLVDHPEADDTDRLLSGSQGVMLGAILRALGIGDDQAYIASALPRHMPLPDWAALADDGLGALVAHHVSLVQPQRVLVFGSNVSSLLGHDPANSDGFLPKVHHDGPRFPALVAPALSALAARPRGKARLWQALLDWTAAD